MDSKQILKRLELVKNLISLEESEQIAVHVKKLEHCQDDNIQAILALLNARKYGNAAIAINKYIQNTDGIKVYEDPEVEGLRFEAHTLETELSNLQSDKAEIEKQIYDFNLLYQKTLGSIIEKLLKLRIKYFKQKLKVDEACKDEFREAQSDYKEYRNIHEEVKGKQIRSLSAEEQSKMKSSFRKASLLIHPDTVPDELKEESQSLFIRLKEAYDDNNIEQVQNLLEIAQGKRKFTQKSESISEKDKLLAEITRLSNMIKNIHEEMETIKQSETYQQLSKIKDWDVFIGEVKSQLMREVNYFEEEMANGR